MTTNFSLFQGSGRCVGDGQGVACGEKGELPSPGGFHKESNVLVGKPDEENDTMDNYEDGSNSLS